VVVAHVRAAPDHGHSYAVVDGAEQALEVSSTFVAVGLSASERVALVGLTDLGTSALLTRLRDDGADPARALRDGQLVIADRDRTRALYEMPAHRAGDELTHQATAAVRDGFTGIRFGGMHPGSAVSPHEHLLNHLVRLHPATVLCLYHAQAPAEVLTAADHLHDGRVPSSALFDDGEIRISVISPHRLRIVGRVGRGNRDRVLAVLVDAAEAGRRTINAASLEVSDPESLHAILSLGFGLTPHPVAQRFTRGSAGPVTLEPSPDGKGRNGFPVPGHTASTLVANLIWRTFGSSRPGRAESVLDWAGLLGRPAGPLAKVANRHRSAPTTVTNRVRQVQHRGVQTPLTPPQLRDATRPPQPGDDLLSRRRIMQILGLPPPPAIN